MARKKIPSSVCSIGWENAAGDSVDADSAGCQGNRATCHSNAQHPTFGSTLSASNNTKRCLLDLSTCRLHAQNCRCVASAQGIRHHICAQRSTYPQRPQNGCDYKKCLIRTSRQENEVQKNLFLKFRSTAFDRDTFLLLSLFSHTSWLTHTLRSLWPTTSPSSALSSLKSFSNLM